MRGEIQEVRQSLFALLLLCLVTLSWLHLVEMDARCAVITHSSIIIASVIVALFVYRYLKLVISAIRIAMIGVTVLLLNLIILFDFPVYDLSADPLIILMVGISNMGFFSLGVGWHYYRYDREEPTPKELIEAGLLDTSIPSLKLGQPMADFVTRKLRKKDIKISLVAISTTSSAIALSISKSLSTDTKASVMAILAFLISFMFGYLLGRLRYTYRIARLFKIESGLDLELYSNLKKMGN